MDQPWRTLYMRHFGTPEAHERSASFRAQCHRVMALRAPLRLDNWVENNDRAMGQRTLALTYDARRGTWLRAMQWRVGPDVGLQELRLPPIGSQYCGQGPACQQPQPQSEQLRQRPPEQEAHDQQPQPAPLAATTLEHGGEAAGGRQPQKVQPQEAQPQEAQPQEAQPQEAQPQEAQPQEAQPQEAQPQEAQPQEAQPQAADAAPPPESPVEQQHAERSWCFNFGGMFVQPRLLAAYNKMALPLPMAACDDALAVAGNDGTLIAFFPLSDSDTAARAAAAAAPPERHDELRKQMWREPWLPERHLGTLYSVAGDGPLVASACCGGLLRVWRPAQREMVAEARFAEQVLPVAMAAAAEGRCMVTIRVAVNAAAQLVALLLDTPLEATLELYGAEGQAAGQRLARVRQAGPVDLAFHRGSLTVLAAYCTDSSAAGGGGAVVAQHTSYSVSATQWALPELADARRVMSQRICTGYPRSLVLGRGRPRLLVSEDVWLASVMREDRGRAPHQSLAAFELPACLAGGEPTADGFGSVSAARANAGSMVPVSDRDRQEVQLAVEDAGAMVLSMACSPTHLLLLLDSGAIAVYSLEQL